MFWACWDYKMNNRNHKPFTQSAHQALNDLTDSIIQQITYRADAPHYIPSPLENFKGLHVH